eukprot:CAMPEP_0119021986 /NCGR_PEP_ID=MMETSP1176-20130426/27100_1 /TAXON_ID=265551 /ORGANISM="Synedropsis recta cf, Strain CCMP1620" /LENGTH=249 /DNA_ID=CAMNT_0006976711 /DNA_START=77 /DNA_END=823 /DNA_ORIENTATION=+
MANETPKTLSKKGLYAPLSVYNASSNPSRQAKIRPSLKDGALIDFLFRVGQEHNRKAKISVGKNNGCKPVSQNDVNDRIRQRALTLIGGGIDTSISGESTRKRTSAATPQHYPSMSNRKRKLMHTGRCREQKLVGPPPRNCATGTWDKLVEVNRKWNDYVHRFLRQDGCDLQPTSNKALATTLSRHMREVGVVGSFVEITACESDKYLATKSGIVVGETTNTWRLAVLPKVAQKDEPASVLCKLRTVAR